MTWNNLIKSRLFWWCIGLLVGVLVTFAIYLSSLKKNCPAVVEDTITKKQLVESQKREEELQKELFLAEETISNLKLHSQENVSITYKPDGTKVVRKKHTVDVNKTTDTKLTGTQDTLKKSTLEKDTTFTSETKKTKQPANSVHNYYAGISTAVSLNGIDTPGIEFKRRLFDLDSASVWIGTQVISDVPVEPSKIQLRVEVGISF